jgi:hypothetical protein
MWIFCGLRRKEDIVRVTYLDSLPTPDIDEMTHIWDFFMTIISTIHEATQFGPSESDIEGYCTFSGSWFGGIELKLLHRRLGFGTGVRRSSIVMGRLAKCDNVGYL